MTKKWMKRMISTAVTAAMIAGSMTAGTVVHAEEEFDWRKYEAEAFGRKFSEESAVNQTVSEGKAAAEAGESES